MYLLLFYADADNEDAEPTLATTEQPVPVDHPVDDGQQPSTSGVSHRTRSESRSSVADEPRVPVFPEQAPSALDRQQADTPPSEEPVVGLSMPELD